MPFCLFYVLKKRAHILSGFLYVELIVISGIMLVILEYLMNNAGYLVIICLRPLSGYRISSDFPVFPV